MGGGEELEDVEDGDVASVRWEALAGVVVLEVEVGFGLADVEGGLDFPGVVVEAEDGVLVAVGAEEEGEEAESAAEVEQGVGGVFEFAEDGGVEGIGAEFCGDVVVVPFAGVAMGEGGVDGIAHGLGGLRWASGLSPRARSQGRRAKKPRARRKCIQVRRILSRR